MTCIVGLEHGGRVYIGADSAGSNWRTTTARADEKVFHNGPFLIGGCGSFRALNLLRYQLALPERPEDQSDEVYLYNLFVERVRWLFTDRGLTRKEHNEENFGGSFLFGYRSKLYSLEGDFQIGRVRDTYQSCGSGHDLAQGAMYATDKIVKSPTARIKLALEAASKFSTTVGGPFVILSNGGAKK